MVATFLIEERPDSNGSPVYFIVRDSMDITSRWTRDDANSVLAALNNPIAAETSEQPAHQRDVLSTTDFSDRA